MQQAQEATNDLDEGKVARLQAIALIHTWPDAAARAAIVVTALILGLARLGLTGAISRWTAGANCMFRQSFSAASCCIAMFVFFWAAEPYLAAALVWVFGPHLNVFYLFGLTLATACALLLHSTSEKCLRDAPWVSRRLWQFCFKDSKARLVLRFDFNCILP